MRRPCRPGAAAPCSWLEVANAFSCLSTLCLLFIDSYQSIYDPSNLFAECAWCKALFPEQDRKTSPDYYYYYWIIIILLLLLFPIDIIIRFSLFLSLSDSFNELLPYSWQGGEPGKKSKGPYLWPSSFTNIGAKSSIVLTHTFRSPLGHGVRPRFGQPHGTEGSVSLKRCPTVT